MQDSEHTCSMICETGRNNTGLMEPLSFLPTGRTSQGPGRGHYLGVLVDLGDVLLIAVDIQANGGPCTPGATQSKNDAGTICKNEPQALGKISRGYFFLHKLEGRSEASKLQGVHLET